nr:tripartite tricarboxylate transporter substrate-binding protein [Comamonas jiangduensis]
MRRDTFLKSMAALAAAGLAPTASWAQQAAAMKMMLPANPGGGWDTTGRALGKALQDAGVASSVTYDNKGGAAGAIGLAQFVNGSKNDPNALMVMGAVMLGGIITGKPPVTLKQVTPLARLTSEYNVFVLPANSPFKNMGEVIAQLKKDPGSVKWGGGSRGSTEHIAAAMIAKAVGVDPAKINYVAFRGGGEAISAILGGNVTIGGSGYSEFAEYIASGKMKPVGYGGSTPSILLNTPGETASMVTAMEGNKMAKNGRAGAALATAAIGSFVAGTVATVVVTLFAPTVADFAVKLGPPEYFMLMVLAFTTVSAVLGQSSLRGMTALFIGLALGCVGMDQITGSARYTGGKMELMAGVDIVLVAVGLFAVAEVLYAALYEGKVDQSQNKVTRVHMTRRDWKRSVPAWLRGTIIGTPFGCIPAGGTEIPTFLSYATEKKLAKGEDKAEFGGKGAIEGVAGPEAANNATVTAALIPLLTLGIPTSNTTAVLLGAFQNYGINPGPQLFSSAGALVWALIASLYIGNLMLLVLNLPMVGLWVKLLKIPRPQLYAGILIFATVGAYGMRQSTFDLFLLYGIGLLGVLMRRFDFPTAPVVVGMILGPLAEAQMRNAVSIGEGSFWIFLQRPMSLTLVVIVLLVLIVPRVLQRWAQKRAVYRDAALDA